MLKKYDIVTCPSILLFPMRTGKWSRHHFSPGIVTAFGTDKNSGAKCVKVLYVNDFRYREENEFVEKWFTLDMCKPYTIKPHTHPIPIDTWKEEDLKRNQLTKYNGNWQTLAEVRILEKLQELKGGN